MLDLTFLCTCVAGEERQASTLRAIYLIFEARRSSAVGAFSGSAAMIVRIPERRCLGLRRLITWAIAALPVYFIQKRGYFLSLYERGYEVTSLFVMYTLASIITTPTI